MSGPLSLVQRAIVGGAASRTEITTRTGLDPQVVDAAIDHLVLMGRLTLDHVGSGCPDQGCGACPSRRLDGGAGCGATGPANARGPVAITLTRRSP